MTARVKDQICSLMVNIQFFLEPGEITSITDTALCMSGRTFHKIIVEMIFILKSNKKNLDAIVCFLTIMIKQQETMCS